MIDLLVIVPSRGRPATIAALTEAFDNTCTASTRLVFAIDDDDPTAADYAAAIDPMDTALDLVMLWVNHGAKTMVSALNNAALDLLDRDPRIKAVAFMGDDHLPRTDGWDQRYLDALAEMGTGIVYGDDLLQHERIPTQAAMTADIIRALGHMAPPVLTHLFVDNYWRDLGQAADCLRYLPEVVVEHVHPMAGKAVWDDGHRRVNAPAMYQRDSDAYADYAGSHLADDIAKVKALR
jgi:hypothetical protein